MNRRNAPKNIAADVINALGGIAETAAIFGVSKNAVQQWRTRQSIPAVPLAAALLLLQARGKPTLPVVPPTPRPPALAAMHKRG